MSLLEVDHLSIAFKQYMTSTKQHMVQVMNGIDLTVEPGEITAIFGASGSGKSLLAHAILGILPAHAFVSGSIRYKGRELDDELLSEVRGGEIAFVPQAVSYLNPLMKVGTQIRGTLEREAAKHKQRSIFSKLNLPEHTERLYPHQLSGGMARKTLVAAAAVGEAQLIIADEPTPGMPPEDVKETLQYFKKLAESGIGVLLISHDIEAALTIADNIAVFYAGTTVEVAAAEDFVGSGEKLRHPYSQALWRALPQNDFVPIPGAMPHSGSLPTGCVFAPRCLLATSECQDKEPPIREVRGGKVRCIHAT